MSNKRNAICFFIFGQNMREINLQDLGLSECAKDVGWHLWNISGHSFAITNVPKKKINEKDSGFLQSRYGKEIADGICVPSSKLVIWESARVYES